MNVLSVQTYTLNIPIYLFMCKVETGQIFMHSAHSIYCFVLDTNDVKNIWLLAKRSFTREQKFSTSILAS